VDYFPTSPETLILEARGPVPAGSSERWRERLGQLCAVYRPSIVRWMIGHGVRGEEEDLAHAFLERWLAGNPLASYERGEARFRDFLKTSLRNFCVEQLRRHLREKRGGGALLVDCSELDLPDSSAVAGSNLDTLLVRQVAWSAMRSLKPQLSDFPEGVQRELLSRVLRESQMDYPELAGLLGATVNAARLRMARLRQDFLRAFHAEVAGLCRTRHQAVQEQREFLQLLCQDTAICEWIAHELTKPGTGTGE